MLNSKSRSWGEEEEEEEEISVTAQAPSEMSSRWGIGSCEAEDEGIRENSEEFRW
jgi:hypothetical protein